MDYYLVSTLIMVSLWINLIWMGLNVGFTCDFNDWNI